MSDVSVAIIGMSVRLPGARTLDALWEKLCTGTDAVERFEEVESSVFVSAADRDRPDLVKSAAILGDIDQFAATFFRISLEEARLMDPQHRILLECAWEALENAGQDPTGWGSGTGVFVGTSLNRYLLQIVGRHPELLSSSSGLGSLLGADKDFAASRISYALGLTGPSIAVQSACSSSLVAVHMACQSLLEGECDLALAGGAALLVPERAGYLVSQGGLLSPDGHTRVFDQHSNGAGKGSGAGVVALKRHRDAERDGDFIWAVIKGSAVNNDGGAKVAYSAPALVGQAEVVEEALAIAGVEPETVSYIETHGSGTRLGDAVEVAALRRAFVRVRETRSIALGAARATFGSLDAAMGIIGLVKATLSVHRAMLVPMPNGEQANRDIAFGPFFLAEGVAPFPGSPRRAGVSSFGVGGTNAHVILEESPARAVSTLGAEQMIVLSAASTGALERMASNLAAYMREHPEFSLADVASTLRVGRRVFAHRRAFACASVLDAIAQLDGLSTSSDFPATRLPEHWQRDEEQDLRGGVARRVPLPTYPFERERCWFDFTLK